MIKLKIDITNNSENEIDYYLLTDNNNISFDEAGISISSFLKTRRVATKIEVSYDYLKDNKKYLQKNDPLNYGQFRHIISPIRAFGYINYNVENPVIEIHNRHTFTGVIQLASYFSKDTPNKLTINTFKGVPYLIDKESKMKIKIDPYTKICFILFTETLKDFDNGRL